MKMLLTVDVVTLIAIAVCVGVLLTAGRRSLTNPALLLLAALCFEIICAMVSSAWLRGTPYEPYVRAAGRVAEFAGVVNFIIYLLPYRNRAVDETHTPDKRL